MSTPMNALRRSVRGVARMRDAPKLRGDRSQAKPGGPMDAYVLGVLLLVWAAASTGTGYLLALLARRIHPGLSLPRLWLFYTVLMATLVAAVFLIGFL